MMTIKRGDTAPSLRSTLTDNGAAVDLTSASAIRVVARQNGNVLFTRTAAGDAAGVVDMPWQTNDTVIPGIIWIEWEVTWPGGKIQTFPAGGYEKVWVAPDLGGSA